MVIPIGYDSKVIIQELSFLSMTKDIIDTDYEKTLQIHEPVKVSH